MEYHSEFEDRELKDTLGGEAQPLEASSVHINQLRLKLRANTRPSDPQTRGPSQLGFKGMLVVTRIAAIAVALLFVFLAIQNSTSTATASLRSVLDITRRHVWIHSSTTVTHAGETVEREAWCAPLQRITAYRSPKMLHFIDYAEGVQSSYSEDTDTVFRWRAEMNSEEIGRAFIGALLSSGDLSSSFPYHHVSAVQKMNIVEDGVSKVLYSFQLELKSAPKVHWETLIRVNPSNELIETWEEIHSNGTRVLTRFDYPSEGPTDIFALGANREAKVIDRVASSDVVELSKEFQYQVHNFDDYEALVVDRFIAQDGETPVKPLLRRIRRQGKNFSVDLLQPVASNYAVPEVVDLPWWKSNRSQFGSTPLATCDGDTCTIYPSDHSTPYSDVEMPWSNKLTTLPVIAVKNAAGMTTIPIWPSLWPEYACRPFLVTTDPCVRFDIDPTGTDGPPNTMRIRLSAPDSPFAKERATYWLALDETRCVLRSNVALPSFDCLSNGPTEKLVINDYSGFQKSPSGIAYATQRISSDANSPKRVQRTFVVDFDVH